MVSITPVNPGLTGFTSGDAYPGSFNAQSNMNTVVYWGQGANQERLRHYCQDDGIDIINLAFLNVFPDQSGGYPGTNFGNACGDQTFQNTDGTDSPLLSYCPHVGHDIKHCQDKGKTILLSLGGAVPTNQYIKNHQSAVDFADFLWKAFGPEDLSSDVPRPFGDAVVDGFDFDIESILTPKKKEHKGYGTMIDTLRAHFAEDLSKTYYISGAPQCIIPDAHLAHALKTSWFDFIFVQFYNTPECSARAYFDHNYGGVNTDISFDGWVNFIQTKALNKDTKIYLGLPAAPDITYDSAMYLNPHEAKEILEHFQCKYPDQFGGAMVYEATSSDENRLHDRSYVGNCKHALKHNDREQCAHRHHHHHSSSTGSFPSMTFPTVIPTGYLPTGLFPSGSGIYPVYPTGTGIPSGVFPSGIYPSSSGAPSGIFPSGSVIPSGVFPSGSVVPSGVFPSGSVVPSGVFPSGSVIPSGVFPSGSGIPSGVFPSGSVIPSGVFPSGSVIPSGVFPSGSVIPSGVFPSGSTVPTGIFPSGSVVPSGVFPSGSVAPSGVFPSGSVIPTGGLPSGSGIPSGIGSPSSSAPSNPTGTAPSNTGSLSSMPTMPSSSQPFYPLTNSSRPITTSSQPQTSENSSPTTNVNSPSQTSENSSPITTPASPSQTSEKSSPTESGSPETIISVVSETDVLTVTSCGPEVTNCPARSHSAVTTVIPVSTITQAPSQGPQTTQEVVVTEIVTSYVTTCPVAHTITSAGRQIVQTGTTTSTVYETITSTICTKCVAPQKTVAPAGSHSGSNSSPSHPGSNSGSQGPNSPSSPGSNAPGVMGHGAGNVQSIPGSNIPGSMGHGAENVQSTPGSQTPAQSPSEQGQTQEQQQGPAQLPSEQGPTSQEQQQSPAQSLAEQGPNQIASTIAFVPVETMTVVPVPKYPYQTAHPSSAAAAGTGSNAISPSGTVSAGVAAGTGSPQNIEAFKGAASRTMGAGVFGGVVAVVMAGVVIMM